jgi:hypothetical protein
MRTTLHVTFWCQKLAAGIVLDFSAVVMTVSWIKLIRLLNLRVHHMVISPYYGDATDDGNPAGND